jgi:hypothetical protein
MKRKVLVLGVVLAVMVAVPSFAAIEYEFTQKTTTEDPLVPTTNLTARAVIDGTKTRVDFRSGTLYPPGTYAVTTNSRQVYFVDPANKSYTEVNMSGASTALAASSVKIENFKSGIDRLNDRQVIAGIEAEHYRVTISYDITVRRGNIPLKRHVITLIDSWNTSRFGEVGLDFITGGGQTTGNPQLDQLLEATKIPGFPLQQTVTTKTRHDLPNTTKSELKVAQERTSIREMWVTKIRETTGAGISFIVPAIYARADAPDAPRAATKTLTFDGE